MPASSGTHIQTPTPSNLKQYNAAQPDVSCKTTIDMPASQPCSRTLTYLHYNNAAAIPKSSCYTESDTNSELANVPTTTYITPATRNTQYYNLPYARTEVYKSSFFPSTIKLWNNLQPAIINSTTIPQLREALQSTPTSGRRGATLSA